ncbi:MAG: response regulator [Pseudomonadota bacterium]|nr:response regulator [Pseudomonadota bacterium]
MDRDDKLLKDRKILRRIDQNLALQSRFFIASNILVFLFVASVGGYYVHHVAMTSFWGALLFCLSAPVFYLALRFDPTYGAGPARWRSLFVVLQIANSLCMGMFCAVIILIDKLSVNGFLLSLYMVGYSSINNVEWSPYNNRNAVRLFCNLAPTVVAYAVIADINGLTIAVGLLVILVMLLRQSRLLCIRHWDNVRVHHELHTKARDLAHAASEANSASQYKTEFLSNITHEIRTPMNNVLGMLALLDDTELSAQQRELQNLAVQSGEGLLSLIDDIVDFSRITSGQIQLNESVFHVKRCIDQTLELLGPRAHEKGMELSCTFAENLPVRVRGDQGRLAQLINNLVSNAIKYSDGSDIVVHVDISKLSETLAELRVTVKDNGRGIDPDIQDHLFEAFSKTLTAREVAQGSTGLGLAISKGLAECMQGDMGFTSSAESGTEFWFTVQMALSTQQAQKLALNKELLNKSVLVVGAQGGVLDALFYQLATWDMMVESVASNSQVSGLLQEAAAAGRSYDLLIVNMPVLQPLDLDFISGIQQSAPLEALPRIIVLSSLAQRADVMRMGLDDTLQVEWLSKPLTREKVCRALIHCFELDQPDEATDRQDSNTGEVVGRRVLLVEDNAVNQMVAKGMLNKLGYVVTSVVNGKEALGMLEEKDFDLILMDCMMPILDGYETTAAWREKEASEGDQRIPILAMTASVVEGEQQKCLACGMDDYLSKPVKLEELDAKMRQWLGSKGAGSPTSETSLRSA